VPEEKASDALAKKASALYTAANPGASPAQNMLDHLIDFDPPAAVLEEVQTLDTASPKEIAAAQHNTAEWLESLGAPTLATADAEMAASLAQTAFKALTTTTTDEKQREALVALKTPPAVRHLTGMLTAYDWAFVEQAKELRGYCVAQILEETKHPDAKVRLKALDMLGRVTEIALFTDRVEIKKTQMSDNELESRIKEKLNKFMGVQDAEIVDIAPKSDEAA
jgi:hypothetical protein